VRLSTAGCALLLLLSACDAQPAARPERTPSAGATPSGVSTPAPAPTRPSGAAPTPSPPPPASPRPRDLDVGTAVRTVSHLAGTVGPRHATSPAFARAATWTEGRLRALGYDVRRQRFTVPSGTSWGVPVRPGGSANLVARSHGFRPDRPHLLVGAHLDTVPQAPGAEDNASGIGVLLAVAESVAGARTRLPVVFVAFGAEEPRGPTDLDHHYGSRHYVGGLTATQRRNLRGMVSLDRVGVGRVLPVCGASAGHEPLEDALLRAARRAKVAAFRCAANRSSDHWSFVRAGLPGVRLGSTPYAGYHSAADLPPFVNRAQLARAGRTVLSWLRAP
jgi:aminopeptidase YwaD